MRPSRPGFDVAGAPGSGAIPACALCAWAEATTPIITTASTRPRIPAALLGIPCFPVLRQSPPAGRFAGGRKTRPERRGWRRLGSHPQAALQDQLLRLGDRHPRRPCLLVDPAVGVKPFVLHHALLAQGRGLLDQKLWPRRGPEVRV